MMKKILFFLLLAVFTLGISAQGPSKKCPVCGLSIPKCQYKGKHPKKRPTPTTPAQQQPSKPAKHPAKPAASKPKPISVSRPTGTIEGHGYVDLGLSVKWATQNVGASSPSDYGGYYTWGETETKSSYDWNNCFDCLDGKGDSWGIYKIVDSSITPTSGHDTARENWGGTWRMPTVDEFEELCTKCKWTWTSQGGHNGYKVTGPNGNSIFLPAAGERDGTYTEWVGEGGYYWSSSLGSMSSGVARTLQFVSSEHFMNNDNRRRGLSVRPVTEYQPAKPTPVPTPTRPTTGTLNGFDWVDLGLSVKWATKNVGASSPSDYGGYYAWGETETKSSYDWSNCFDCLDGKGDSWGTYKKGGKTSISPTSGHDTARENWGGTWRMPTEAEFNELCTKCKWTWTSQGGHNGYLVTSKINGNSIFLPASGWRDGTDTSYVGEDGYYWSSTLDSSISEFARFLYLITSGYYTHYTYFNSRRLGQSVRPVTE